VPLAAIYARISKDGTGAALGVERQERLCRDLAAQRGLDVNDVYVDNDLSAYNGKHRPGLESLLAAVDGGRVQAIVCYHVDRLYRRSTELERLVDLIERTKAEVLTVAAGDLDLTTASGRLVARLLSNVAQAESERMGERLRAKNDDLARAGRPPGGRPKYGYGPGYVVDEAEARWVRHAAGRVLAGWSLVRIARELDELGVPTRQRRAPWHHSTVRNILVSPAIAGLRIHRREVAGPASWEPILDRDTWQRVRAVLADPARRKQRTGGPYLLSGLVRSPEGGHMNGRVRQVADGTIARSYGSRHGDGISVEIGADRLEAAVVEAVLIRFDGAALPTPAATTEGGAVDAVADEMADLARCRGEGTITMAEWLAAREPLQRRLEAAQAAITPSPTLPHLNGSVRAAWPSLTVDQRQTIIRAVVGRIVVRPAGRSAHVPVADRATVEWKA